MQIDINKKIFKNNIVTKGILYTLGGFLVKGINFITIPIFTRLLNTVDFGIISLYNTWVVVFSSLIGLSLNASIIKAKGDFKNSFSDFLSSILFLGTLSLIPFLGITIIFRKKIYYFLDLDFNIIMIMLVHSFFIFVTEMLLTKFTAFYETKKYILVSFFSTLLNVILSIILIISFDNNKYLGRIYGSFISVAVFGVFAYFSIILNGQREKIFNKNYWFYGLRLSLPLIPHQLSAIILVQFDRIMINKFIGPSEAGIYSFAYTMGLIVNIIYSSINNAWVPWFYDTMDNENFNDIKEKNKCYIIFITAIVFVLIFLSPEIVKIMSSKSYWRAIQLVPIIMVSYFFNFLYTFPVTIESYFKKNHLISIGTLLSAIINIALNFILIPVMGYMGAAIATLVSYLLLFIFHYLIVCYSLKVNILELKYFIYSILFMCSIAFLFYILIDFYIIRYFIILILLIIVSKVFKKNFFCKK